MGVGFSNHILTALFSLDFQRTYPFSERFKYLVIGYWLFDKALTINSYILNKYRLTFAWVPKRTANRLVMAEQLFSSANTPDVY
jgi:hypothetical protein